MFDLKNHLKKDALHHAYLLEGEIEMVFPKLVEYIESELSVIVAGNPDVIVETYSTFKFDDVGILKSRQGERAVGKGQKFFILQTDFFNLEAQHALLKVFEEPAVGVHFFILSPRIGAILDTLSSRLVHIVARDGSTNLDITLGKNFLKKTKSERLEYIAKIVKSHEGDDDSGTLRSEAISLVNSIELQLYSQIKISTITKKEQLIFKELSNARKYLSIPGASVKMLLEEIALLG